MRSLLVNYKGKLLPAEIKPKTSVYASIAVKVGRPQKAQQVELGIYSWKTIAESLMTGTPLSY